MKKEKRKEEPITESGGLGISGFTLGVMSIILAGWLGLLSGIVGFIFCKIQQKKNPIKLGRIGIILNIIGVAISLILILTYTYYLLPMIQQQFG